MASCLIRNLSAVPVSLVGSVGFVTLNSYRFSLFLRKARKVWFHWKAVQAGGAGSLGTRSSPHVPGRACSPAGLPGAGTASPQITGTQPALTCGNPAPSIAQTPLEWQLHWAGSSSFPVYDFVDWLHHSAMEKFKCFVTFHWEDTTKLKCLYCSSI